MKSFSQFLQESYLNEEPAGRPARRRTGGPSPEEVKAQIDAKEAEKAKRAAARKPSGAAARPDLQFKKSTVASPAAKPKDPWTQFPKKPQPQMGLPKGGPSSTLPGRTLAPAGGTSTKPALPAAGQTSAPKSIVKASPTTPTRAPIQQIRTDLNVPTPSNLPSKPKQLALPAAGQTGGKPPSGPKIKVPSGLKKVGRVGGKLLGPAAAALDVADEKAKGSGWARSLAKGAAVAAGSALGGAAGSVAGPVGTVGGSVGGAMAASKAFDVAAGANAKERAAMAAANRQRQAGTAVKGIGGKTTFDTKKNTMTTGVGSQQRTVGLAKTGVVQRGGQSTAGHLAYKGGQAVYKAGPSAQSLAKTSSNPLERIGRTMFAGAYKKHDIAKSQQALQKARQSDAARQKALGVKMKPGG